MARAAIAKFARREYWRKFNSPSCEKCGYSLIPPDVAHIKPVAEFPDDATLREINNISNLCGLCSRCHLEYDAGLIPKSEIEKIVASRSITEEATI